MAPAGAVGEGSSGRVAIAGCPRVPPPHSSAPPKCKMAAAGVHAGIAQVRARMQGQGLPPLPSPHNSLPVVRGARGDSLRAPCLETNSDPYGKPDGKRRSS